MKMLFKGALIALGVAGVTAAQAQYNPGDLVLGFTGGTAGSDVLFDIGTPTSIGVSGSSTVNLNNSYTFSLLGANGYISLTGAQFGVIGYSSGVNAGIYSTVAPGYFPNTLGNRSAWGIASGNVDDTGTMIDGSGSPANSAVVSASYANSWSANVAHSGFNTFYNNYGNPDVTIGSGVTETDLYYAKDNGSAPQMLGAIDINPNTGNLTFTPTPTPEPGTTALLATFGALAFAFRRFFHRNS